MPAKKKVHAAAVGEVTGPNRGVVEDVEDLRRSRDQWKKEWELSERNKMDREAEIVELKGFFFSSRGTNKALSSKKSPQRGKQTYGNRKKKNSQKRK